MSKLSVVKASAGSGKTFKLTYEYIKLLVDKPDVYRHILAVTFTNKATYEMKERILNSLFTLSKGGQSPFLPLLTHDLKLNEGTVQQRAWLVLNKILHNYSRFSVETIDTFFQRLIRAFTREIGLNAGYRIELNTREVLGTATDRLLFRVDEDKWLKNWLTRYAGDKIMDGKSWNIRDNIHHLGNALFNESFKLESAKIQEVIQKQDFLKTYQHELQEIIARFDTTLRKMGDEALEIMRQNDLDIADFSYKDAGVAGFFNSIRNKDYEIRKRVEKGLEGPESWYSKSSPRKNEIHNLVDHKLRSHLQKIVDYIQQEGLSYYTAHAISKNLYTLGILNDLLEEVEAYCREEDLFLISDSAFFLQGIIGQNDAPFIYEKAGNYYQHFMIDEFQDTSEIQYQNFRPLIENSLSQGYSNLIVGDVKQSIYRWRNSNWEVFENQVTSYFNQMVNEYSLGKNWRSLPSIVTVNNRLFETLPGILQQHYNNILTEPFRAYIGEQGWNVIIEKVYAQVKQEYTRQSKDGTSDGYVEICTRELEQEEVLEKLINDIKKLQDHGYRAGDIAVLVRKSEHARIIVQHLLQQSRHVKDRNLSVVSNEALLISYSNAVKLLINVLHNLVYPDDQINTFEMAYFYHTICKAQNRSNTQDPISAINFSDRNIRDFIPQNILDQLTALDQLSLYEAIEQAISILDLYRLSDDRLYLNRLLDVALDFQERRGSDLFLFLEYWKKEQDNLSVNPSDGQDAIRVLTIHKSKGLEFKAVLMPFCDWSLDHDRRDNILWCKPRNEPFSKLPLVPVFYSSNLVKTGFAEDYYQEMIKTFIDNLNLLYVALTRASEALIITAAQKPVEKISKVSHLLQKGCGVLAGDNGEMHEQDQNIFVRGNIKYQPEQPEMYAKADGFTEYYTSQPWSDKLKIAFQGKEFFASFNREQDDSVRSYGQLMHEIFSRIISYNDIEKAVNEIYFAGKINATEKEQYINELQQKIMNNDVVKTWFEPGKNVFSEKTIYQKDGGTYRPDRVVRKDNELVVVDYKFGENPAQKDIDQVIQYLQLVEEVEGLRPAGYIWYYHADRVEKVESPAGTLNQLSLW